MVLDNYYALTNHVRILFSKVYVFKMRCSQLFYSTVLKFDEQKKLITSKF